MVESRVNDLEVLLAGVERRLDQMQQALTTQQGSTNLIEASHQQVHREVREMVESIRNQRHGPHTPPQWTKHFYPIHTPKKKRNGLYGL